MDAATNGALSVLNLGLDCGVKDLNLGLDCGIKDLAGEKEILEGTLIGLAAPKTKDYSAKREL